MRPLLLVPLLLGLCTTVAAQDAQSTQARVRFAAGMTAMREGRIDVAKREFAKAAELTPQWGLAYLQWGIVEKSIDPHTETALSCLETAVALSPNNARARYELGLLYQQRNQHTDAIEQLARALELRPQILDAQFRLATAHQNAGNIEAAIAGFAEVLNNNRQHSGALVALAELFEKSGQVEKAEQALVALTHRQPQLAYNHYRLAQFYERVGDEKKARRAFRRANALDPRPQRKMRKLR